MGFSPEEIRVLQRASSDFVFFVNEIFSKSSSHFIGGQFVDDTARFLSQHKRTVRVSARNHFKSYSFYAYFMWKLMFEGASKSIEAHYFSFNNDLAAYHVGKIKVAIMANPYFRDIKDSKPTAESVLRYTWDRIHYTTLTPHGLVQFKRGIHGDIIFVDDPFQDPDNELNPSSIFKINEIFKTNILDMPKEPDGILHVAGCLTPDTIITMGNGSVKELSEVKENDYVIGYDLKNNIFIPKKVIKCINNGVQDLLEIKIRSGKKIKSTFNHPYLTREGWKEAKDLSKDDYIALPTKIITNKKKSINNDEVELLGYVFGDGSIGKKGGFGFSGLNMSIQNRVKVLCENLNLTYTPRYNDKYQISIGIGRGKNKSNIREKYNLKHCNAHTKEIPDQIFQAPIKTIGLFLKGLFETDGSLDIKGWNIGYGSVSKKLFFGTYNLLLQMGIHSDIRLRKNAGVSKKCNIWELGISNIEDVNRFLKITGAFQYKFDGKYRKRKNSSSYNIVPLTEEEIKLAKKLYGYHSVGAASIDKLKNYKEFDYLTELDIYWSKIKEIKKIGKNKTLNLTVDGGNFIANCILTHNTPQTNEDFFFDPNVTKRFAVRILPAITVEGNALWPEWMNLEELKRKEEERTLRVFKKEYLCTPVYSTKGFFDKDVLYANVVNKNLVPWDFRIQYNPIGDVTAGFDIGKKTHPSHLTVFVEMNGKYVLVHQKFMDGWSYSNGKEFETSNPTQIEYIKLCIKHFKIRELRYDNTRGEFETLVEQRLLPREMIPVVFTTKARSAMSTIFDRLVERRQIELIDDRRFISQICAVTSDLEAITSSDGHGDAFWSVGLAFLGNQKLLSMTDDIDSARRIEITIAQPSLFSDNEKVPKGW